MLKFNLKTKFILFWTAYTALLIGCFLLFFSLTGQSGIKNEAIRQVNARCRFFDQQFTKELADTRLELSGLESRLNLHLQSASSDSNVLACVREFVVGYPYKYHSVIIYDSAGQNLWSVSSGKEFGEVRPVVHHITRRANILAYKTGLEVNGALDIGIPVLLSKTNLVRFVMPIGAGTNDFLIATIRLINVFDSCTQRMQIAGNEKIMITNHHNIVVYSNDSSFLQKYVNEVWKRSHNGKLSVVQGDSVSIRGGVVTQRKTLDLQGLALCLQRDINYEMAQLRRKIINIFIFSFIIFIMTCCGFWIFTDRLAKSLQHITFVSDRISQGDFSQRINIQRTDELGTLVTTFNGMVSTLNTNYRALNDLNSRLEHKIHELRRARIRLSEKQRLALLGETISKISHEIQNKIGGISIWVQNLERSSRNDETTQAYVTEIKSALASFMGMLTDFKRFYREPLLTKHPVNFSEMIDTCLKQYQGNLQSQNIRVHVRADRADGQVNLDEGQMHVALTNLLLNAIYYSPENGIIEIQLVNKKHYIVCSIADQGPGLPVHHYKKVFHPFYTTKSSGSGLGLAIVHNIVRAHRGTVRCYNRKEGGACFEMKLPIDG